MRGLKRLILNILFVAFCVVVAYYLSNYMFTSIPIKGDSMEQTIHNEDRVIVYKLGKYNVGDIIIFDTEIAQNNTEKRLIKRIIGLPGDTVEIKKDNNGKYYVYRNGKKVAEDYTNQSNPMSGEMDAVEVPQGKFFYLGDNRGSSWDSRYGELGELDTIIGRALLRYQPNDKKFDLTIVKRGQ